MPGRRRGVIQPASQPARCLVRCDLWARIRESRCRPHTVSALPRPHGETCQRVASRNREPRCSTCRHEASKSADRPALSSPYRCAPAGSAPALGRLAGWLSRSWLLIRARAPRRVHASNSDSDSASGQIAPPSNRTGNANLPTDRAIAVAIHAASDRRLAGRVHGPGSDSRIGLACVLDSCTFQIHIACMAYYVYCACVRCISIRCRRPQDH